ncbi:MAG: hypothetical protein ACK441_02950, partial [Burkholderiales bacterium]
MKAIAIKAFEAQTIEDKLGFMNALSRMLDAYRTGSHGEVVVRQSQTLDNGLDPCLPPWGSVARFPSYPQGLELVSPQQVGRRRLGSPRGRAELLHAIAHIEW